jgi:hypothetical protein
MSDTEKIDWDMKPETPLRPSRTVKMKFVKAITDTDKIKAKLDKWKSEPQSPREQMLDAALRIALEKLAWYATATYPDDGSGRPPDAYQRRANQGLHAIAEALEGKP